MKLIITSLFKAMPAVGNVFGVVLTLQLVFAILGLQLFSGKFGSCNNPAIRTRVECADALPMAMGDRLESHEVRRALKGGGGTAWVEGTPLHWTQKPTGGSFDDFGGAMLLLYVMSSGDQWELPMFAMMGATEPGHAAVRNDTSSAALFAIIWMFVGYVFAINLFVGVVVDNFSRMQKAEDGSATMTPEQQQWAETMKSMVKMVPTKAMRPPTGCLRGTLYRVITSQVFDGFITLVIVLNIVVMACDYWGIEQDIAIFNGLNTVSFCFGLIYYVECVMKMTALGPVAYFADSWCQFDFFLVCTSLLDQFAADFLNSIMPLPPMLLRVLRVLRILRILRLLKGAKELRNLIVTMVLSFPSLLNVGSLLALIIFIYAVLGVNLFTFLNPHAGASINTERNFVSFGSSFLLLFQCLTGDGWSSIMADAMLSEESGQCSLDAGDCGSSVAIPYFISFQILGAFVFLNLVVAVILENFEKLSNVNTNLVSTADLELFSEAWAEYDPDADNYIPVTDVPDLLLKVPKPLGVRGKPKRHAVKLCLLLKLETVDGEVAFSDLLKAIIDNNYIQSGANLDEFKEVVPGVVIPPVAISQLAKVKNSGSCGSGPPATVQLGEIFGKQVFEQDHVKGLLRNMLRRARKRIDDRGGPEDPRTYEQVYVKGGYANQQKKAEAMQEAWARTDEGGSSRRGGSTFADVLGGATSALPSCSRRAIPSALTRTNTEESLAQLGASGDAPLSADLPKILKEARADATMKLAAAKAKKTRDAIEAHAQCAKLDEKDPSLLAVLNAWSAILQEDDDGIQDSEDRLARIDLLSKPAELAWAQEEARAQEHVMLQARERLQATQGLARESTARARAAQSELVRNGYLLLIEAIVGPVNLDASSGEGIGNPHAVADQLGGSQEERRQQVRQNSIPNRSPSKRTSRSPTKLSNGGPRLRAPKNSPNSGSKARKQSADATATV